MEIGKGAVVPGRENIVKGVFGTRKYRLYSWLVELRVVWQEQREL